MLTLSHDATDAPDAVMWTVTRVASRDGVSKQTVSSRVKRFREQHGLHVETDAQGHVARLNVAQYDSLRGRYDDPSKAQQRAADPKPPENESYEEATRQKAWLEAERRRIELDELKGKLGSAQLFADALDRIAVIVADKLALIDEAADDISAAVGRDGPRGARAECKSLRHEIADALCDALAAEARKFRAGEEAPTLQ